MTQETKVVLAYKAFDKDLKCRGFQYEIGKTYEHAGKVLACESGFHACENPLDMWTYYPVTDSRFCVVELSGELNREGQDSKIASGRITVKAEIGIPQIVTNAIEFVVDLVKDVKDTETESYYSTQAASGDHSTQAASGYSSTQEINGKHGVAMAAGVGARAKGGGRLLLRTTLG